MISAQMLTGIPEVDLGIDVKIQNIERTEKAKKKLLEVKMKIVKMSQISMALLQGEIFSFFSNKLFSGE